MSAKRGVAIGAAIAGGAALLGAVAVGATAASLARTVARVDRDTVRPVTVTGIIHGSPDRVWLRGDGTRALGAHSLLFDAPGQRAEGPAQGHARLGPVLERRGGEVLREVIAVDRGALAPGARGRMVGWWYTDAHELGYRVEHISIEGDLGPLDGWIVHPKRARKKRWAIHVHGRGASHVETLRGITPLARAGITSVVLTYRNDIGQPAGIHGRYGLGLSESADVEAAIAAAVDRGAERVTLVGWSMGGTASLVAASRSKFRNYIDGLVLDSPGTNWPGLLRSHAAAKRVPGWIAELGVWLLAHGWVDSGEPDGINFAALTPEAFAESLSVPVLLLVSPDDQFVPWEGSKRLAALRPDLVYLQSMPGAGHVRLWNADPEAWEQSVLSFVTRLPRPGWREQ